jgi:hypothetical protein
MTSFIELIKFKNILRKNQIELFDHDLRISHHRLCNWFNKNKEQFGGSINVNNYSVSSKLKNMSQIHLSHLVYSLLDKNEQKINWILNSN